ncbi:nucleoside kinase [candidate division WOR-3 bacterium]|nr:nucleoside kinase [candidate division WOR-3 bacterium]
MKLEEQALIDLKELDLWRRYQSTLSFILFAAIKKIFPARTVRIEHSISKGFYCLITPRLSVTQLRRLKKKMTDMIEQNIPITTKRHSKESAIELFRRLQRDDRVALLATTRIQSIPIYTLQDINDTYLIPPFESTGSVNAFDLRFFRKGIILRFPTWRDLSRLPSYEPQTKLARIFNEYEDWGRILGITDISDLNKAVISGKGNEIIKITEALHERKIVYISDTCLKEKKRLLLIAGPSSAGKTTTTKRLAIQLLVNGIRPLIISADDYFLPHSRTPRDEFGRMDFESINAVDIELLNHDLRALMKGEPVTMPMFNFVTGRRNKGNTVRLPRQGVILLEGIHCLNQDLTPRIPRDEKFKIYVSALTQLNIDDHNRVSTTDTRMLRRIVRDTHFRGYNVKSVLHHLACIRAGEEKNIYPYQEEADEMFNSALVYEPAVMKRYVLPIARRIKKNDAEYTEIRHYVNFLMLFRDLDARDVPSNSILREFIGSSSFRY